MRSRGSTTVFHVTHYKAGSQWIRRILTKSVGRRLLHVGADRHELFEDPIVPGRVYSACYVSREEFDDIERPPDSRHFFIARDLRDTLVSGYFSLKLSHPAFELEAVAAMRNRLRAMGLEEGLMHTLDDWVPANAEIQRSWIKSEETVIHFEDLLANDVGMLEEVLLGHCRLGVRPRKLRRAIEKARFERLSGGRAPGEEDVAAHYRKGVTGDWRNYFNEPLKDAFKERYGDLLIEAGYERDNDW
jgi:lipopolysaccharide transport system ATP-binding protein